MKKNEKSNEKKNGKSKEITRGKDDFNLCECPFTILAEKAKGNNILTFVDKQQGVTRNWKITGSAIYGLPCSLEEPVYVALMALTKWQGLDKPKIEFNQLEMFQILGWPDNGQSRGRLRLALNRLLGVIIETNYLWQNGKFSKGRCGFGILDAYYLSSENIKGAKKSWFRWSKTMQEDFESGSIKSLNLEKYFDLKTPTSKRLYRLCDKRMYKSDRITFDLKELCHEKLGISRKIISPSLLKQALEKTLAEHKEKKILSAAEYKKGKDGNWLLILEKCKIIDRKLNDLYELLKKLGINSEIAKKLITEEEAEVIKNQIEALPFRKNVEDQPAFLLKAILENYSLPAKIKGKLKIAEGEKLLELKQNYTKSTMALVNLLLSQQDKSKIEEEIAAFTKGFMEKMDLDEISMENPGWLLYRDYEYKKSKAIEFKLPTFEEWITFNREP